MTITGSNASRIYVAPQKEIDCTPYEKIVVTYRKFFSCVFESSSTAGWGNPEYLASMRTTNATTSEEEITTVLDIKDYKKGYLHATISGNYTSEILAIAFI